MSGRGDRRGRVRCQHLDAESGHGVPLQMRWGVGGVGVHRGR
ncbi:hypothetical protein STXM2123_2832 [Streptomyces sp. F-3]|nr:hypothetical protein STXM2123_2832 [Streptomyces sp. F-3]